MNKETKLFLWDIFGYVGVVLIVFLPIAIIIALIIWDAHVSCDTFASINPDFDVMWVKREGCMVKYNGMFIHVDDVVNVLGGRQ